MFLFYFIGKLLFYGQALCYCLILVIMGLFLMCFTFREMFGNTLGRCLDGFGMVSGNSCDEANNQHFQKCLGVISSVGLRQNNYC